ncbi:MAG: tetratricopeptide repeat protein, partial [Gammaproteobacteria bacterium]|nr:tetratricopeptide repeat protein [Gammaproteobacteria bacterium]
AEAEAEPSHDSRFDKAYEAIERGDYDAAAAAYEEVLAESPGDAEAQAGLAQVS